MCSIAVIIPLYNGARWIEQTLASVVAQARQPDEILVVDDGSEDDGVIRAQKFAGVRVLRNPNKGPRPARNHGLQQSHSSFIAFLDQDDVWHPRHLESLAGVLETHPDAAAASSACVSFDKQHPLKWPPFVTPDVRTIDPWESFPFGSIQCPSMALARRDALMAVGGWNPKTEHVADIELWQRLAAHGTFLQSDAATVGVRGHADSYSGVLRCRHLERYLISFCKMAGSTASERLAQYPDSRDWLSRRIEIAEQFLAIGVHFVAGNADGLVKAVDILAERLEHESATFRSDAFQTLFWFLCPPGLPGSKRRLLAHLHAHWPERAGVGRSILWARMKSWPLRTFITHLLCRPWQKERLALLRQITKPQCKTKDPDILTSGVDKDGWARRDCAVQIPGQGDKQGVRMGLEMPGWAGVDVHPLTVAVEPHPQQHERLPSGHYELIIPWKGNGEMTIALRCDSTFRIPQENRMRSLRITGIQYVDHISVSRPVIQARPQEVP